MSNYDRRLNMATKVKIDDHIEAFVEFKFSKESDCTTGFIETLGGPIDIDVCNGYFALDDFSIIKVLVDGIEISDYKSLGEEKVNIINSVVEETGNSLAEDELYYYADDNGKDYDDYDYGSSQFCW